MKEYVIYYKNKNKERIIVENFSSNNDEDAIKKVDSLKEDKDFVEKNGSRIFWAYKHSLQYLDIEDDYKDTDPWYKRIYYSIIRKIRYEWRPWFNIKLAFERVFRGYDRRVTWDIGLSMMNLLRYAIPVYIKNLHGCPTSYCERARKMLTPMTDEELKKSYDFEPHATNKEMSVAMGLYSGELKDLLESINVISYYEDYGIQETDSDNYVDPSDYPIPHLKNSEMIDYEKLHELREKKIDEVFTFLRKHIDEMWD